MNECRRHRQPTLIGSARRRGIRDDQFTPRRAESDACDQSGEHCVAARREQLDQKPRGGAKPLMPASHGPLRYGRTSRRGRSDRRALDDAPTAPERSSDKLGECLPPSSARRARMPHHRLDRLVGVCSKVALSVVVHMKHALPAVQARRGPVSIRRAKPLQVRFAVEDALRNQRAALLARWAQPRETRGWIWGLRLIVDHRGGASTATSELEGGMIIGQLLGREAREK